MASRPLPGEQFSHQTRGNAPAGQHEDLTEPVGCVSTEWERNNSLFLSNRVMIREQALLRPVMCQRVDDVLVTCASGDSGAPPICFHPACDGWFIIRWLVLIWAYELRMGKKDLAPQSILLSLFCLLGPRSILLLDNHAAREAPEGGWRFSQGLCSPAEVISTSG